MFEVFKYTKGFTLIELLVVLAIIGIISGVAAPHVISMIDRNNKITTGVELSQIRQALLDYYSDNNSLPASTVNGSSGLTALIWNAENLGTWKGPYISTSSKKLIDDEFRNPYEYYSTNTNGSKAVVISGGKDNNINSANYDNFDFTIVKDANTTGFPWDVTSDDLIINIVAKGTPPTGTTTTQAIADVMTALFTCGGSNGTGNYGAIQCNKPPDIYMGCPSVTAITSQFQDSFGNNINAVSCDVVMSGKGSPNNGIWQDYSFLWAPNSNPMIDNVTSNEQDICRDLDDGVTIGTNGNRIYNPNVITQIHKTGSNNSPSQSGTLTLEKGNKACP